MSTHLFFDELSLERSLDRMSPRHRLVFAIACVERIMPTSPPATVRSRGATTARMVVYRLAREFKGATIVAKHLPGLEATCARELSPQLPGTPPRNEFVQNVVVAARHCVRCRQTGDPLDAIAAARGIYEEIAKFAARQLKLDSPVGDHDSRVAEHPLVQAEIARQRRDLDALEREPAETLSGAAAWIWRKARCERAEVFGAVAAPRTLERPDAAVVTRRRTLLPAARSERAASGRRQPTTTGGSRVPSTIASKAGTAVPPQAPVTTLGSPASMPWGEIFNEGTFSKWERLVRNHPGRSVAELVELGRHEKLRLPNGDVLEAVDTVRRAVPTEGDAVPPARQTKRVLVENRGVSWDEEDDPLSDSRHERMLVAAAAELGLDRAFSILEAHRKRARGLLSPPKGKKLG